MLEGARVFIGFPFNANGLLFDLVEDLGGAVVERLEEAEIIVALKRPQKVPDGVGVFVPQGKPLEEFCLFCLCGKFKDLRQHSSSP